LLTPQFIRACDRSDIQSRVKRDEVKERRRKPSSQDERRCIINLKDQVIGL